MVNNHSGKYLLHTKTKHHQQDYRINSTIEE